MFVPIASFTAIKFITELITKTALTKLLENTVDESLKLKNMIGMSDQITLMSEFLPDNVGHFENSYFAPCHLKNELTAHIAQCLVSLPEITT